MLDLAGVVKEVAGGVETFATGRDADDMVARGVAGCGQHGDTGHDLGLAVDEVEAAQAIERAQVDGDERALLLARRVTVPVAPAQQVAGAWITGHALAISDDGGAGDMVAMGV